MQYQQASDATRSGSASSGLKVSLNLSVILTTLAGVLILGATYLLAQSNYLLFHSGAEGFAIVVAALIYVLGTRTEKYSGSNFLAFLANAYLFIAILDFLHTMTFKGMGVFPGYTTNAPTQLWIAGRYVDAISLLVAPLFIRRSFPHGLVLWLYAIATGILVASIMLFDWFPDCYVDGSGLTPFKIGSEYVISLILLGGILHLRSHRGEVQQEVYSLLVAAMAVTIVEEMAFTLYTDVYGVMNFLGHILKIVAYYLLYRGIVLSGIEAPYREVQRLNDELERRISERTAQLEATNRELEAFGYSVSHDLRAPLRAVDGFSEAVLESSADKLDERDRDYLRRVRAATARMGQLIEALLSLSRITRHDMERESVDLTAMAREIAEELQRGDPSRKVEFAIEPGLVARGDVHLLRPALENLLSNAWKFTARRDEARVELGAERRDGETIYHVRDNGAGFDQANANRLFGAFQRLHSQEEFPGTGIGLATVQRVIHRHGGRIWAEGAVDGGATFYFTL